MIWLDDELKNPLSGKNLRRDSPHSLTDGANRFPVVAEIPYLRANRGELCDEVLRRLDDGDEKSALILLLQDRDDWASGEPPTGEDLQPLFAVENLSLRDAMRCLKYGAVADYFAYRWSDPTFLSGLSLLEYHLPKGANNVFELACGIGHYLREFDLRNIEATGADVVFSKLWLARKFVAPRAKLICFDANFDFPFADEKFDAAFCHDAFYFLPEKRKVVGELRRIANGVVLIGHAHNSDAENYSSGAAIPTAEYASMFENAIVYDDTELTKACVENRQPKSQTIDKLTKAEAISLATTAQNATRSEIFSLSPPNRSLRVNPLLGAGDFKVLKTPQYPSERYEKEYAALSGYLKLRGEEDVSLPVQEAIFDGQWNSDAKLTDLARRRIFLDLPENW